MKNQLFSEEKNKDILKGYWGGYWGGGNCMKSGEGVFWGWVRVSGVASVTWLKANWLLCFAVNGLISRGPLSYNSSQTIRCATPMWSTRWVPPSLFPLHRIFLFHTSVCFLEPELSDGVDFSLAKLDLYAEKCNRPKILFWDLVFPILWEFWVKKLRLEKVSPSAHISFRLHPSSLQRPIIMNFVVFAQFNVGNFHVLCRQNYDGCHK